MRNPFDKLRTAVALSLGSLVLLFAEQFIGHDALSRITPWAPIVLSIVALALVLRDRRLSLVRASIIISSSLTFLAGVSLFPVYREASSVREHWRTTEVRAIAATLRAVGERAQRLQELSTAIGDEMSAFVIENKATVANDSLGLRLEAFRMLEAQAKRITDSEQLPPGTEIGIQLLGRSGKRLAWAGWPQRLFTLDLPFVESGKRLVYSRQVSLYQILTHIIPCIWSLATLRKRKYLQSH